MADKKKSGGFMNKFMHKEKDARPISTNTAANDSTYGSDLGSRNSYNSSSADTIEKNGSGQQLQPGQHQIVNDQGQVVTVTTTTTTTTTTSGGQGGQGGQEASSNSHETGPHDSNMANRLDPRVNNNDYSHNTTSGMTDMSARDHSSAPNVPHRSTMRDRSPQPTPVQQTGYNNNTPSNTSSMSSDPYGAAPGSPSGRHNFSYPNRGSAAGLGGITQAAGRSETFQGIKTAAAGIHGAGEALRGTLNGAVDKRFNDADAYAKNRAVAESGRTEIETGRLQHANRVTSGGAPPAQQPPRGILKTRGAPTGAGMGAGVDDGHGGYR